MATLISCTKSIYHDAWPDLWGCGPLRFGRKTKGLTFQVFHDGWGGHAHGDGSWLRTPYFGSEKFLFIEDKTFRNAMGIPKQWYRFGMVAEVMLRDTIIWLIPQ